LLNPENVFPSILIIPSVNADCSGVLITKGITNGKSDDQTVAFNRGVGGAVEGQASETWLIESDSSYLLLAPAREPEYMAIPASGGTKKVYTNFSNAILTENRLSELRNMAGLLREKLPSIGMNSPYDVELGFVGDKIWLFQVRPFVENKRAASSEYLQSISPVISTEIMVELDQNLDY
jgi:hypothetical protein